MPQSQTLAPPQSATSRLLAVFLGRSGEVEGLAQALERIPVELVPRIAEVAVFLETDGEGEPTPQRLAALQRRIPNLRVLGDPKRYGHGARRKVAFEYALQQRFDHVVVLEPDARFAPEHIATLWNAALQGAQLVIAASRARTFGRTLHDLVLDLEVADYASPFRLIACSVLDRVPFHSNEDGRGFDTELLIQCRALGVDARSIALELPGDGSFPAMHSLAIALGYRAHQLHLTRRGQYFVDHDVHYTLKQHRSSSHMQVLEAIAPGALVLDLGCSQGLLAAPLRQLKHARVVGVDVRPPQSVSTALDAYYQRDLEQPLEIPEGRVFDYVVCSDVIEHVIHRTELLRSVRRYLKPEGRLLISTPNIAIWFYRASLLAGRFEYGPRGVLDETHVHLFTRATFRREIENAAFRVVRERVTALPFEIVFESTGRSRLVRALASGYHALARLWPEMFAYQFLIEAEVATLVDAPR